MESSPVREVRPRLVEASSSSLARVEAQANFGHDVDRAGGFGGGTAVEPGATTATEGEPDPTILMQREEPWRKRTWESTTTAHMTTTSVRLTPPDRAASST